MRGKHLRSGTNKYVCGILVSTNVRVRELRDDQGKGKHRKKWDRASQMK